MYSTETTNKTPVASEKNNTKSTRYEPVLQVERRDFIDLVPEKRPRVQSLRGFDDCYTDIVDYIVRCTHKIWDERDVGLIYTHYTHNCVLYNTLGTMYNREQVVQDTLQRLIAFPERRGMATQVIWNGNDVDGFYTSHLVTGTGRHTQYSHLGKPTNRTFVTRTVADCMIHENKIYREWVVSDNMAVIRQTLALIGMIPDGAWMPQHICSNSCEESGTKVAVRWIMEGHHLGYGELSKPTGERLFVMGCPITTSSTAKSSMNGWFTTIWHCWHKSNWDKWRSNRWARFLKLMLSLSSARRGKMFRPIAR